MCNSYFSWTVFYFNNDANNNQYVKEAIILIQGEHTTNLLICVIAMNSNPKNCKPDKGSHHSRIVCSNNHLTKQNQIP